MHWMRDLFRKHHVKRPEDPVPPDLVRALLAHPRFSRLHLDPESVERLAALDGRPTHVGLLSGIFGLYAEAEGKPLVGNKTAPFVRRIPELHRFWPGAKFVHIVRDGRDVCLSMLNWQSAEGAAGRYSAWEEDPVSATALWWKRKVLLGREGGSPLGPGLYHEVRYESLVADAAAECGRLCAFLDVPYDDTMLRFHEGQVGMDPDLERDHPTLPITAGLRDWRTQMSRESVERFEAAAGDLLRELGYPLATDPRRETLEHAARIHESFAGDAVSRGQRLPEGW